MAHSRGITLADLPNGGWEFDESREAVEELNPGEFKSVRYNGEFAQTDDERAAHIGWVWDKSWGMWVPVKWRGPNSDKAIKVVRVVDITHGDPVLIPTPEAVEADLRAWWNTTSEHDLEATIPKAVEYGSESMVEYGRTLARVAGRKVSDAEALEWAIYAYLVGKVGRWTAALQRGEKVSEDTLFDMEIYVKMARKVRETGTWT